MKKSFNILAILFCFATFSFSEATAQTVLMEVERGASDTLSMKGGPNSSHFAHLYLGFGNIFLTEKHDPGLRFFSPEILVGLRYKLKLSEIFASGLELEFNSRFYNSKENINFLTPFSPRLEKQQIASYTMGLGGYFRVNFKKERGNVMGTYLDLGAKASYSLGQRHHTEYTTRTGNPVETTTRKVDIFDDLTFSGMARLGYNRYAIYFSMFLAPPLEGSFRHLPENYFIAGIQLGLHR